MIIYVLIMTLFISWQIFEFIKYGDDFRVNVFTTGDYDRFIQSLLSPNHNNE